MSLLLASPSIFKVSLPYSEVTSLHSTWVTQHQTTVHDTFRNEWLSTLICRSVKVYVAKFSTRSLWTRYSIMISSFSPAFGKQFAVLCNVKKSCRLSWFYIVCYCRQSRIKSYENLYWNLEIELYTLRTNENLKCDLILCAHFYSFRCSVKFQELMVLVDLEATIRVTVIVALGVANVFCCCRDRFHTTKSGLQLFTSLFPI
jgi:hypothetical protein